MTYILILQLTTVFASAFFKEKYKKFSQDPNTGPVRYSDMFGCLSNGLILEWYPNFRQKVQYKLIIILPENISIESDPTCIIQSAPT